MAKEKEQKELTVVEDPIVPEEVRKATESEAHIAELTDQLVALSAEVSCIKETLYGVTKDPGPDPKGMEVQIFGTVYCPKCGLPLQGHCPTGLRPQFYSHPFTESAILRRPCDLKGKKYKPSTVFLEEVQ